MSVVSLRAVRDEDLLEFYEHQIDAEACQMAGFPSREREAFLAHWDRVRENESNIYRTILYQEQVAGNVVSFVQEGQREVGYWIGREFWGKGIASQALAAFLQEVALRPLYAHVVKHNTGSIRVLEKCGFLRIGENEEELIFCKEE